MNLKTSGISDGESMVDHYYVPPNELNPGEWTIRKTESKLDCRICLSNVPAQLTKVGIQNLCLQYGCVIDIHVPRNFNLKPTNGSKESKCPFIFVEFANVGEAENAIRGINGDKSLGLKARFAQRNKQNEQLSLTSTNNGHDSPRFIPRVSQYENYASPTLNWNLPIPNPVSEDDYANSPLSQIDPNRNYLIGRNYFQNDTSISTHNNKIKYVSGRAVFEESQDVLENLHSLSLKSDGKFDSINNIYVAKNMDMERQNVLTGNCVRCEKITEKFCEICSDFYCSEECQKMDWPKHKKVCRAMPKLVSPLAQINPDHKPSTTPANREPRILNRAPTKTLQHKLDGSLPLSKLDISSPPTSQASDQPGSFSDQPTKRIKNESTEIMIITTPPVKNSKVFVTSVSNEKTVFIRKADTKSNSDYQKILNEIAVYSVHAPILNKVPAKGDFVLAAFEGEFSRAVVLRVDQDHDDPNEFVINIAYIDYGNTNLVKIGDLRYLDKKIKQLPRHSLRVYLMGIKLNTINDDIKSYLNSLLNNVELNVNEILHTKKGVLVDLKVSATRESVSQKINELAIVSEPTLDDKVFLFDDLAADVPDESLNVKMFVTDTSLLRKNFYVSCIENKNLQKMSLIEESLQDYGSRTKSKEYCPGERELCLAKDGDKWFRAVLLESLGDGNPMVMMLDLGNVTNVSIKNLRKMPKQFMAPLMTHVYGVKGLDETSSPELMKLAEKLLGIHKVVTVQNIEIAENLNELVIADIVNFDKLKNP